MKNTFLFVVVLLIQSCVPSKSYKANGSQTGHLELALSRMGDPSGKIVLVAAHRGDWRNHPENSIGALQSAIEMGADIAEFDLKRSKDGHLIIMHDRTIDRTTNGKGRPEDYTLAELRKFRLKNGLGRVTNNLIPTFEEYLDIAKGRIIMDVDKGYEYFPEVISLLKKKEMIGQALINVDDNSTLDQVEAKYGKVAEDLWLMPIVDYKDSAKARLLVESYLRHKNTIYQPVWSDDRMIATADFQQLRKDGYAVWLNSLWPSLNGGHDDDLAIEQGDEAKSWGWLIDRGATIIQTDRPLPLLGYLYKTGKH